MNTPSRDPLDAILAELPRDMRPSRDLWTQIKAEIAVDACHQPDGDERMPAHVEEVVIDTDLATADQFLQHVQYSAFDIVLRRLVRQVVDRLVTPLTTTS